jgi:hypothetical protein
MKYLPLSALLLASAISSTFAQAPAAPHEIVDASTEHKRLIPASPDGGLPPLVGVQSNQIYRATHSLPDDPLGKGYTYNHHTDMAIWKGRLYLAWTNGQKDEDVAPAREVYATSLDGSHWSKPAELFPEGTSVSMRMYFFHAPNGRMLTTAGARVTNERLLEEDKRGLLVREILADHSLGPVYTIIPVGSDQKALEPQPPYTDSKDAGFVEACKQLLDNHTYLEQQDFGVLLGKDRRMQAYVGQSPKDYGRAFCFFYRKDGALVAIGKEGYGALSTDNGKTWTATPRALSLNTDSAKVWAQKTSDGRYALLFNPHPSNRFPLVILSSDDGITFKDMRLINGDVSIQRYSGLRRSPGNQYMRGVSIFANDGSRNDKDMFVAYSSNKEDIWCSRIAIPLKLNETQPVNDQFNNATTDPTIVPDWNTYSPVWAPISIVDNPAGGKALQLTDADPYDLAHAERVFPESKNPTIAFTLLPRQAGTLIVELRPDFGLARPVHVELSPDGKLQALSGKQETPLGEFPTGKPLALSIAVHCDTSTFDLTVNGQAHPGLAFTEPAESLTRLELQTGPKRPAPARNTSKTAENDKPLENPAIFLISNVTIK